MFGRGRGFRGVVLDDNLDAPTPGASSNPDVNDTPPQPVFGIGRGLFGRARPTPPPEPPSSSSALPQNPMGRGIIRPAEQPEVGPKIIGRGLGRGFSAAPPPPKEPGIKDVQAKLSTISVTDDAPDKGDKAEFQRRPRFEPLQVERKHGTRGENITLSANFIKLNCTQEFIYQYVVDFSPVIDSKAMRFKLFNQIPIETLGPQEARAFDGKTLYLPKSLPQKEMIHQVTRPTDNISVHVKISLTNETPMISCPSAYNVIFKRVQACLKMVQVGRNYYNPDNAIHIPEKKLEIWPGYVTAISRFEGGLLLMVDVSHKIIRQDTVYNVINETVSNFKSLEEAEKAIAKTLIGETVLTRYNNSTNMISDFDFKLTPKDAFERNGQKVSYLQYYKDNWNIQIRDKDQPMIVSKQKKVKPPGGRKTAKPETIEDRYIMLVPELCYLTGLTEAMRSNMRAMRDLHEHTRITPQKRYESLKRFIQGINRNEQARCIMKHWGLEIAPDTLSLDARRFDPQQILFHEREINAGPMADFKNNLKGNQVVEGIRCPHWLFIYSVKSQGTANQFKKVLVDVARQHGIDFAEPQEIKLQQDRTDAYVNALMSNITPETCIVLTMFASRREDVYARVKQICYSEKGVASQCVIERTLSGQKMRSVAVNIALQMNVKLGGVLWMVKQPVKHFMCVGIDVYHEGRGGTRRSVGGIVGSVNKECTKWYSSACYQEKGQEMIDTLTQCFVQNLREYYVVNNCLPQTIVIFRDGVGDGRLTEVQTREIPQLMKSLEAFNDYKPQVVFVVVSKRVNTRIFVKKNNSLDNPGPGTVLDHTVTKKDFYDFYMVPQSVRQGTVTPTHFNILYDTSVLSPDQVQLLTFKMCHMYYNWPGTVRVPAPCLYAHKIAYLSGQYLRKQPSEALRRTLFYL